MGALKFITKSFKKPTIDEIKKQLTDEQFSVTQCCATELPFENAYWNMHEPGIYVDLVSGEPLFSSVHKYDSGTGWPSFSNVLEKDNIVLKKDHSLSSGERIEVRSKLGDSHLGHVFNDGPAPTHLRYCINSAAIKFIPASRLKEQGYEKYSSLFAA